METNNDRAFVFVEIGVAEPGLINAGCYVLPTEILNGFVLGQPLSLEVGFLAKARVAGMQRFELFVTNDPSITLILKTPVGRSI